MWSQTLSFELTLNDISGRTIPTVAMTSAPFPILSLAKFHSDFDGFAKDIFDASRNWGFFLLTEHGLEGVDKAFELVRFCPYSPVTRKWPLEFWLTWFLSNQVTRVLRSSNRR